MLLAGGMFFPQSIGAEIYSYVDKDGVMHFTNTPTVNKYSSRKYRYIGNEISGIRYLRMPASFSSVPVNPKKYDEIIKKAIDSGINKMIVVGYDVPSSERALEISKKYRGIIYASCAIHPHDAENFERDFKNIEEISKEKEIVAIGETGLDFYREFSSKEKQIESFKYHIEHSDIYDTIKTIGADKLTLCAFCSRFRRGILYRLAPEMGCNKIALGHHADDMIETLLLNAFYEGRLETMPAYLNAEDGKNIVIRPLAFVWEKETLEYARQKKLPVICCKCPACKDFNMKRKQVKLMLSKLEEEHPGIKKSFLRALQNFSPDRLLAPEYYKKIPAFS